MKTQDSVDTGKQGSAQEPERPKHRSWIATAGAIIVVALIAGASVGVYSQLILPHKGSHQGQAPPPHSASWSKVLDGYTLTSIEAADSNPAVLYACATPTQASTGTATGAPTPATGSSTTFTILRSTDYGSHWQDIGSNVGPLQSCDLAVNPANSNEVYLATMLATTNGQNTSVLKHTTDGGQTWTTIRPTFSSPQSQPAPLLGQLSIVANQLFGIAAFSPIIKPPVHEGPVPAYIYRLPRLVMSTDGGHTWHVLDQRFSTTNQGTSGYAVDPTNTSVIYDLVSTPLLAVRPQPVEPAFPLPVFGVNAALYKTTDGGATWQPLLQNLPFITQIALARNNPQLIYAVTIKRPLPYVGTGPHPQITQIGSFQLKMSTDGGATWHDVPAPSQKSIVQAWFVNANGQVYVYSSSQYIQPQGQGTAIPITPVATAVVTPQSVPPTGNVPSTGMAAMSGQPQAASFSITASPQASILMYDPSTNQWSTVTSPPTYGTFLGVTGGSSNSDILWFLGSANGQVALYRYVV